MKRTIRLLLIALPLIFSLIVVSAGPQAQDGGSDQNGRIDSQINVDSLLQQMATRADQFERALPDFIATELLTQEDIKQKNGKILEHSVAVSRIAGRQMRVVKKDGRTDLTFKESRQLLSVNDKPAKTDELKTRGAQVSGTFTSFMLSHFAARDQQDYYYDLSPEMTNLRGREAYLVTFLSRVDRNNQFYLFEGRQIKSQQRGQAWIDLDTLTPLRIEYHEINLPKGIQSIFYAVDYAPVELDGELFMLPIESRTEIVEDGVTSRVIGEYRDYKKFSTDVKLDAKLD